SGASPVIVAAAERIRDGRRLGRPGVITFGLALAGLALLVGPGGPGGGSGAAGESGLGGGSAVLIGCGLALLAAAGFAAITVIGTSRVPGLTDLAVNGYGFALGGLVLTPLAVGDGGIGFRPGATPPELLVSGGLLLALTVGPTSVAYTLYYRGLRTETAATAALLTLLEPLTAAVLGAVFLGDRLGPVGLAGALLLGIALVRAATRREPATGDAAAETPDITI
ncbi:MAG: EamA family transporter, partial [Nocardiopsaceae bacterium]|nr:EamA family transporter [Nocardiopsaceae bacterium]